MTFKTGKQNAWHRKDAEIAGLKAEIEAMRNHAHMARFAREIGENIMLILANKPFDAWPETAKVAFRHAQDNQETTAYLYKRNLPGAKP